MDQEKRAPRTHASSDDAQYTTCLARKLTITIGARGETRELWVASGKTYRVRGIVCPHMYHSPLSTQDVKVLSKQKPHGKLRKWSKWASLCALNFTDEKLQRSR